MSRSVVCAILFLFLAGCNGKEASSAVAAAGQSPPAAVTPPLVILIGGFDSDPSPEQIAGTAGRGQGNCGPFQLCGDLLTQGCRAEYFNWNGTRAGEIEADEPPLSAAIAECIRDESARHPEAPLIIVGNSWGGHTAWEVCELLSEDPAVDVDLVVFLDPSSLGRYAALRPESLPECIQSAVTYFTHNTGGWGAWEDEPRIENIDLGDPAHGYLFPGGPAYDSVFNVAAHIAAEWDERIHADIRARIGKLIQSQ